MTTRVLHTADVHLAPEAPERSTALEELLSTAEREAVDVVTIGGDLFDRPEDVETLRPELRNDRFADRPFEVLLLPGNHDVDAYRGDVFFGDSCTVLLDEPFEHWTGEDLRITGLPYVERPDDDLLLALQDREPFDGAEALLLHCSLDAPFADHGTGDEPRYFPVTGDALAELGFDYYLAGHYHAAREVTLPGGSAFAYPGTPASTRESETGPRRACLLDADDGFEFRTLDTFHYASAEFTATPGAETDLLGEVREWADRNAVEAADASVRVDGFVEQDEDAFHERLVEAAAPASVTNDALGARHVTSRQLFAAFEEELAEMDWDEETADAVWRRTVEEVSRLVATGEI